MTRIPVFFLGASAAFAQIVVPVSNPSQPVTVKLRGISGRITVVGGGPASQVTVEAGDRRDSRDVPQGMHRIDNGGMTAVEDHNVVIISPGSGWGENVTLQVPTNASLQLKTVNGKIGVARVSGEMELETVNSSIVLEDVSGNVVASTQNAGITARFEKVTPGKPMSFTTVNGKIDVTLPADTKARLRLKTENGSAYSDFDVKQEPDPLRPPVSGAGSGNALHKIGGDQSIYGSINGGGPEYRFETMNGSILIHKK